MKESKVSSDFLAQRIQEIIEETLVDEKELQIEKLMQEAAFLRSELAQAQKDLLNAT